MPRKTKSWRVAVLRPSRRSKSSTFCSPRQTLEKNRMSGKKCKAITKAVTTMQMPAMIQSRCRCNQCIRHILQFTCHPANPKLLAQAAEIQLSFRTSGLFSPPDAPRASRSSHLVRLPPDYFSEGGREDRQWNNNSLNEESRR